MGFGMAVSQSASRSAALRFGRGAFIILRFIYFEAERVTFNSLGVYIILPFLKRLTFLGLGYSATK